jgi:predicted DsbA family dithiol-disulfide isomerase
LRTNFKIEIRWTAFPLHPDTPEDGLLIEDLFTGRSIDIKQMMMRLKQVAVAEGLPYGDRKKTYNSRLAQELAKWAEKKGKGDEFHKAVFRAYFADSLNISKIPTLAGLAKSIGLSDREAQQVLKDREFRKAVDLDWSRSYEMGVTAVPTFKIDQHSLVGAQPYQALEQFVRAKNIPLRQSS